LTLGTLFKGKAGLLVTIGVVIGVLIGFPAYRWFLAISVGIGVLVAAILFLWHKLRPVRAEDVEDKHPLKLE